MSTAAVPSEPAASMAAAARRVALARTRVARAPHGPVGPALSLRPRPAAAPTRRRHGVWHGRVGPFAGTPRSSGARRRDHGTWCRTPSTAIGERPQRDVMAIRNASNPQCVGRRRWEHCTGRSSWCQRSWMGHPANALPRSVHTAAEFAIFRAETGLTRSPGLRHFVTWRAWTRYSHDAD